MESDSAHTVIESCPACKSELDVTEFTPHSKIVCPSCGEKFRVRSVLGHYRIAKLLGEGGMSQVFAADDVTLGRRVALKILHQSFSRDESLTSMFEREAKLTAAINHPNVVKVYTVGRDQGYFYIAMELVWAVSVEQLIATKGAIKEELVLRIAEDVVSGLRAAQGENLIHRDIKPGNMLVMGDSTTKLVDFGLAVHQDGVDEDEDLWATPFYVPPEKLEGEADTYLGDIYSLGATLYHAIAGEPAFVANTSSLDELIEIKKQPVDLKSKATHASKGTIKLIDTLMAYKAEDRPQSYDEILEKIGEARQKAGITKEGAGSGAERRKQEQKLRKRYLLL
ncbi:MAG: serine/threonine-protein kinase, partial [Verrucomicrobiota bacterium]